MFSINIRGKSTASNASSNVYNCHTSSSCYHRKFHSVNQLCWQEKTNYHLCVKYREVCSLMRRVSATAVEIKSGRRGWVVTLIMTMLD